jgi:hypothetical protein
MSNTFRTILEMEKAKTSLNYDHKMLSIGSCFAENIATYMKKGRFHIETNPFGILYNPISIATCLDYLWSENTMPSSVVIQQGELWHSFLHHGSFSQLSEKELYNTIEQNLEKNRVLAKQVTRIIVTLGTANVYEYRATGEVVANCHKIPNKDFDFRRLSIDECIRPLEKVFQQMKILQPNLEIILTISPIRHIRDGLVENQRSKATLLLATEALVKQLDYVHYFPAYEIVLDDLRDYRFFKEDMIHPSEEAIAYVWEAFVKMFFDEKTITIFKEIENWHRQTQHRPLFPQSNEYKTFLQNIEKKEMQLKIKYPKLAWIRSN